MGEEAYIDDIPFNTAAIYCQYMIDHSKLALENFCMGKEEKIDDIPFNTRNIYLEHSLKCFDLCKEGYFNDIPFCTSDIYADCLIAKEQQLAREEKFMIEPEQYIDDINFNTWLIAQDSGTQKNTIQSYEFELDSFKLQDEAYINDIPWDTKRVFCDIMTYPEFAQKNLLEGSVFVSFYYDENGYIVVDASNSSDATLEDYVLNKLKNQRISRGIVEVGKEYIARFDFRLE